MKKYPHACKDHLGRLRVGAAVGVGPDMVDRTTALIQANVDVVVIDTAHGHSEMVIQAVRNCRKQFPDLELIAGNVATAGATRALVEAGVDAVKVGVGPGSICTTRVVAGVGVPQMTGHYGLRRGGLEGRGPCDRRWRDQVFRRYSQGAGRGVICVPSESVHARNESSPGETILFQGRTSQVYRGMGSVEAMRKGSKDRYFREQVETDKKLVPEGIVGRVPYRGSLSDTIYQLVGGLKAGMGYLGCRNIEELQSKPKFVQITPAGLQESHVHDVIITKEAPNYRVE